MAVADQFCVLPQPAASSFVPNNQIKRMLWLNEFQKTTALTFNGCFLQVAELPTGCASGSRRLRKQMFETQQTQTVGIGYQLRGAQRF